jgi:hypothetical protein
LFHTCRHHPGKLRSDPLERWNTTSHHSLHALKKRNNVQDPSKSVWLWVKIWNILPHIFLEYKCSECHGCTVYHPLLGWTSLFGSGHFGPQECSATHMDFLKKMLFIFWLTSWKNCLELIELFSIIKLV